MKSKTANRYIALILVLWGMVTACSKMDDYKKYLADGPIIYTGRVDSVKLYPGNNRILLTMLLRSDPKITKVRLYWNDRNNSTEQNMVRSSGVDTVKFMLTSMAEGTYNFEIYTYDNAGHSSVLVTADGQVYGQNYINSLFNRSLRSVAYIGGSKARLVWYGPSSQTIGQQIKYTDSLGAGIDFIEPVFKPNGQSKDTTILTNFKKLNYFQYRTLYKPDPNALDTFYSQYQSVQVL